MSRKKSQTELGESRFRSVEHEYGGEEDKFEKSGEEKRVNRTEKPLERQAPVPIIIEVQGLIMNDSHDDKKVTDVENLNQGANPESNEAANQETDKGTSEEGVESQLTNQQSTETEPTNQKTDESERTNQDRKDSAPNDIPASIVDVVNEHIQCTSKMGNNTSKEPTEQETKEPLTNGDENGKYSVNVEDGKSEGENKLQAKNGKTDKDVTDPDLEIAVHTEVGSQDEPDRASVYSLFMEKDFRYFFQHPYARLFIAYLVVFCNFLIYAEDPVAHSVKECTIPVVGNNFAFMFTRYPPNAWSLLKVVLWLCGIITGLLIGKLVIHKLVFCRLFRLKMFTDDQGSWMLMFLMTLLTMFVCSLIYTGFLMIGGDATEPYRISTLLGLSNSIFMKAAACGTWCGDFFTAWMVTDIMLQENLYPDWAKPVRAWWKRGYNRIILFWIIVFVTSFVVIFVIATDYIEWDKLNRDFLPSNELSRAFLASFILVMDLLIVMQDWDFPHFMSAIDIKLPGLNTAHVRFDIPRCLKKEVWKVHITGKWFNYGIIFLVMILDLNMWKNQIFYAPYDYGQYDGPDRKIHTVLDIDQVNKFNSSLLTYDYRSQTKNPATNQTYIKEDSVMNSRYFNYALSVKGIAFIPALCMFVAFGLLIWIFGRYKPSKEDPYAGRLKKRKKKRKFSFRIPWGRREELRRKIHAVPKLLAFKRKGTTKEVDEKDKLDGIEIIEHKPEDIEIMKTKSDGVENIEHKTSDTEIVENKSDTVEVIEHKADGVEVTEHKPDEVNDTEIVTDKPDGVEVTKTEPNGTEVTEPNGTEATDKTAEENKQVEGAEEPQSSWCRLS